MPPENKRIPPPFFSFFFFIFARLFLLCFSLGQKWRRKRRPLFLAQSKRKATKKSGPKIKAGELSAAKIKKRQNNNGRGNKIMGRRCLIFLPMLFFCFFFFFFFGKNIGRRLSLRHSFSFALYF